MKGFIESKTTAELYICFPVVRREEQGTRDSTFETVHARRLPHDRHTCANHIDTPTLHQDAHGSTLHERRHRTRLRASYSTDKLVPFKLVTHAKARRQDHTQTASICTPYVFRYSASPSDTFHESAYMARLGGLVLRYCASLS